ncbi:MAG: response regulator [Candidatus Omnitrophota bacterium]
MTYKIGHGKYEHMDEAIEKKKIVIIDDEKGLADVIRDFLEERGFLVTTAYDGKTGIEAVKEIKPDLVILDILMPEMDGRAVLKKLKKEEDLKDIPVIILSGKTDQFDRGYLLEMGAYEYVTKPYDSYRLLRQINNTLEKKNKGRI